MSLSKPLQAIAFTGAMLGAFSSHATDIKLLSLTQLPEELRNSEVQMLTVTFSPGESSQPHRHAGFSFVYVAEGSVMMGVAGKEPVALQVGDVFYESNTDIHNVSRNLSATETAKIVVFYLKPAGAPIVLPVEQPEPASAGSDH